MNIKNIDMIQANELRIGNWVFRPDINQNVRVSVTTFNSNIHDLKPIPLTEEILLKCGINKTSYGYKCHLENILEFVVRNNDIYLGYFDDDGWCRIGKPIKCLHQLQNLYHALTGQELKI